MKLDATWLCLSVLLLACAGDDIHLDPCPSGEQSFARAPTRKRLVPAEPTTASTVRAHAMPSPIADGSFDGALPDTSLPNDRAIDSPHVHGPDESEP